MRQTAHIRLNSRLLPLLVIFLFALQWISPYDGWLVLFGGLGGAWLVGYLWARSLAKNLRLQREIRYGWAQVGDRLEERFTLLNDGWAPALWVEVADQSDMPGYQVSRGTGVGRYTTNRWQTSGECNRRGLFRLGPTRVRSGDPLGIYTVEINDPTSASLLVTPPVVPLPFIQVAPGGRAGEGRPRPNAPEQTVSPSGVRPYLPGDSLRYIHWRTSARKDDFYVRLLEGTPAGDWWILVDMDARVQAGSGQDSTEEHAVLLAASLADRGLRLRRRVGLAANSRDFAWLPPREGEAQRWEMLRTLALLSPGERTLAELLSGLKPSFGKYASLILVTANTGTGWITPLLPILRSGAVPTVLLLDPQSFGGSGSIGPVTALLTELGIAHYVIDRSLLDRPEAHPGTEGRWEWRFSPTGRAIAIHRPRDLAWKELS